MSRPFRTLLSMFVALRYAKRILLCNLYIAQINSFLCDCPELRRRDGSQKPPDEETKRFTQLMKKLGDLARLTSFTGSLPIAKLVGSVAYRLHSFPTRRHRISSPIYP